MDHKSAGGRSVWIVDDSPLEARMAKEALAAAFTTRVFLDGATVLEELQTAPPPDVLVLDWMMPGITGIEVCKFLRTMPATSELPILLLTSQSGVQQIVEGLAAGASDYLVKPYFPAELVARVTALVRALQVRAQLEGTEQQAAADALHKTELRYRALIEGMPDLVIVIADGRVVFMNPPALQMFACGDSARVIGQPAPMLIHPDEREHAVAHLADTLARGSMPLIQRRLLRHDGTEVVVELTSQAVVFDGSLAVVTVARDLTEQKQTQNQLVVSERMASVGMLAAGVAHEINNPLASVLANLDYALEEIGSFSNQTAAFGELEQSLRDARLAGQRVREIVLDLKVLSRAEAIERRSPIDVHAVLESSLRMASNQIRHRSRLVKELAPVPLVLANEARLGQVFLNLIVNAAQAMPEGRADTNELTIATRMIGGRVAIEIRDTGEGMPPSVLEKLFTPFFTTKPQGEGTGIGLSICYRIIAEHGGEIRVESQIGKGTTFRVLLPVTVLNEREAPALPVAPPSEGRRGKILVVDDEVMIATAIQRSLRREHDISSVTSGHTALEQIASGQRYDVIICDLMMPQMTGMEFHGRLVVVEPGQANRIIFLSGGAFTLSARTFLENVPNQRIEKPFDSRELRGIVNARVRAIDASMHV